jgi:hypothetical protein
MGTEPILGLTTIDENTSVDPVTYDFTAEYAAEVESYAIWMRANVEDKNVTVAGSITFVPSTGYTEWTGLMLSNPRQTSSPTITSGNDTLVDGEYLYIEVPRPYVAGALTMIKSGALPLNGVNVLPIACRIGNKLYTRVKEGLGINKLFTLDEASTVAAAKASGHLMTAVPASEIADANLSANQMAASLDESNEYLLFKAKDSSNDVNVYLAPSFSDGKTLVPALRIANLSDGYLPYHVSGVSGLADSGYIWSSSRAQITTNLSVGVVPVASVKNYFGGDFVAGTLGAFSHSAFFGGQLTAANGSTDSISGVFLGNSMVTQDNSETIAVAAQLYIREPRITKGATDTVTLAATLYIEGSPTEGVNNYSVYVSSGALYLGNSVSVGGYFSGPTIRCTNLSDGYLPYHGSDASGLADSGYAWTGSRAQITTNLSVGIAPLGYAKFCVAGAFVSDGSSNRAYAQYYNGRITAANGDTFGVVGTKFENSITTQSAAQTVGVAAQIYVNEPNITKGSDTVTIATTVYIEGAPTEGETNAALYVASGSTYLMGDLDVETTGVVSLSADNGITFSALAGSIALNEVGNTVLSGFTANSLIGALNELMALVTA